MKRSDEVAEQFKLSFIEATKLYAEVFIEEPFLLLDDGAIILVKICLQIHMTQFHTGCEETWRVSMCAGEVVVNINQQIVVMVENNGSRTDMLEYVVRINYVPNM